MYSQSNTRNYHPPSIKKLFPNYFQNNVNYATAIKTALQANKEHYNHIYITNLSNQQISPTQLAVLHKGLSFVPHPTNNNALSFKSAFQHLDRQLRNTMYFNEHCRQNQRHPFHTSSTWQSPSISNYFITPTAHNYSLWYRQEPHHKQDNLTTSERMALSSIMYNKNITIKRADKGGGIAILNTHTYIQQIHEEQLSNTTLYKPLLTSPTIGITGDTNTLVDFLLIRQHIDLKTAKFIRPPVHPRTPILYGTPKLLKEGHPLRPIVSGIDSPTDNLSKYITHFIQPLATTVPAYIQDSKHFKQHISTIPPLPLDTYLCTADVKALYTNIPTAEGIQYTCDYINNNRELLPNYAPRTQIFRIIMDHILTNNYFSFQDNFFLQIFGAAMGCRMVPPYANIFMHKIDCQIQAEHPYKIQYYKRLIDDIFFVYQGTNEELTILQNWLNNIHPTIKFTLTTSNSQIPFLDMTIYIDEHRKLRTTLYKKPTDTSSYLHFQSNHPEHTKRSIIYSQAIRLNMLIDNDSHLQHHLDNMTRALLAKNYPLPIIHQEIIKATNISQHILLQRAETPDADNSTYRITVPYSYHTEPLKRYIHKYWHRRIQNLPIAIQRPPMVTFSRHKNLADILIHTKVNYNDPILD